MRTQSCLQCGKDYVFPADLRAMFPGYQPQRCPDCPLPPPPLVEAVSIDAVLAEPETGPADGIFVSGCCNPNPGFGSWSAVRVAGGAVAAEERGYEPFTTSNRAQLQAVIAGLRLAERREVVDVFSVCDLSVRTITEWAPDWQRNGWRRGSKREPISNMDLVQAAFYLYQERPNARLHWARKGSAGRWMRYSAALAQELLVA
jgi:ribonuclease HI